MTVNAEEVNSYWERVVAILREIPCRKRIKILSWNDPGEWDSVLIEPVPSAVELPRMGPVHKADIDWMEVDPIVVSRAGKYAPELTRNFQDDIISKLNDASIKMKVVEGMIRIFI
jgi:hypothetical protein